MAMSTPTTYMRLPGSSKPYFGVPYLAEALFTLTLLPLAERCRMYLGADHVLVLHRRLFAETAHRFYFSEIQAIRIRKTPTATLAELSLSVLAGAIVLFLVASPYVAALSTLEQRMLVFLAAGLVLSAVVNWLLGPTCETELITAAHREPLPCLGRWRVAQRVLNILVPRIEAVQGSLSPEQVQAPFRVLEVGTPVVPAAGHAPVRHDTARLNEASFWIGVMGVVWSVGGTLTGWQLDSVVSAVMFLIGMVVVTAAVARQRHTDIPRDVQIWTWAGLAANLVSFYFVTGYQYSFLMFSNPFLQPPVTLDTQTLAVTSSWVYMGYRFVFTLLDAIISTVGLMAVYRYRLVYRKTQRGAQSPGG